MNREGLLKIAKPILFNTEMLQAILEGRKSVTRRVIKPKYKEGEGGFSVCTNKSTGERWVEKHDWDEGSFDNPRYVNPPYQVGDILYVRETWLKADDGIYYRADETPISKEVREQYSYKWKPSIHMPKSIARIFLKVTDVRVERVNDITIDEIQGEGISSKGKGVWDCVDYLEAFEYLWNSTIKKQDLDKFGWDANPFVWVVEFERIEVE